MSFTTWWMKWRKTAYWIALVVLVFGIINTATHSAPAFLLWSCVFATVMIAIGLARQYRKRTN